MEQYELRDKEGNERSMLGDESGWHRGSLGEGEWEVRLDRPAGMGREDVQCQAKAPGWDPFPQSVGCPPQQAWALMVEGVLSSLVSLASSARL